jgi:hypothetical protein
MSISLKDSESSVYSGITGNNNINFDFSKKIPGNFSSNPTGQQQNNQGGDQFEINPESIKAQIAKEKSFDVTSNDDRIQQTSMIAYSNQLNTIKALSHSGKLTEALETVGSINDKSNSWGYSLAEILNKAQIKRNGKIIAAEDLAEALKNDKSGEIARSIGQAVDSIQSSGGFKEKLKWANDKHDGEATAAVSAAGLFGATKIAGIQVAKHGTGELAKTVVGKQALGWAAAKGAGSLALNVGKLGLTAGRFMLGPWGLIAQAAIYGGLWYLNNHDQGKAVKEKMGDAWNATGGTILNDIGDKIGYQVSKIA